MVKICGVVELNTTGWSQADQVYPIACGVKGDGVQLTSVGSKILVAEIVVLGTIYEPEGNIIFLFSPILSYLFTDLKNLKIWQQYPINQDIQYMIKDQDDNHESRGG